MFRSRSNPARHVTAAALCLTVVCAAASASAQHTVQRTRPMQAAPAPTQNYIPCDNGVPVNCSGKPSRPGIVYPQDFGGQVAVVTNEGDANIIADRFVLTVIDLEGQCTAPEGRATSFPYAWNPIMFHNEGRGVHRPRHRGSGARPG